MKHFHLLMLFELYMNMQRVVDSIQHYLKGYLFLRFVRLLNNNILSSRNESASNDQTLSNRSRQNSAMSIQIPNISNEEFQFIQTALPTWLTEVEAKCASTYK